MGGCSERPVPERFDKRNTLKDSHTTGRRSGRIETARRVFQGDALCAVEMITLIAINMKSWFATVVSTPSPAGRCTMTHSVEVVAEKMLFLRRFPAQVV